MQACTLDLCDTGAALYHSSQQTDRKLIFYLVLSKPVSLTLKQALGSTRKWPIIVTLIGYKMFFPNRPFQLVWTCFPISNHVIVLYPGKLFPVVWIGKTKHTGQKVYWLNNNNNNNNNIANDNLMIMIVIVINQTLFAFSSFTVLILKDHHVTKKPWIWIQFMRQTL